MKYIIDKLQTCRMGNSRFCSPIAKLRPPMRVKILSSRELNSPTTSKPPPPVLLRATAILLLFLLTLPFLSFQYCKRKF